MRVRMISVVGCVLLAVVAATARAQGPKFTWQKTDTSVTLLNGKAVVWSHVHDRKVGKPYMRFGLLDGTELTRPWPFKKTYAKADHTWHRALWWSWKAIDGVNYWEEHQEGTDPVKVTVATRDDGSASIHTSITYHEPDKAPVVTEQRVVTVSAPDKAGAYLITWKATFKGGSDKPVVFNRNSYGGFALRLAAEFCPDKAKGKAGWQFFDSEGRDDKANGRTARWVAFRGKAQNGKPTCVAMFDAPSNPRHPSYWQTRTQYPYMNPSFTCKEDYTLEKGKTLTLTYGVLIQPGAGEAKTIEAAWRRFADIELSASNVTVLGVNNGVITINVGSDSGVKPGMRVVLYRDGRLAGFFKITKVDKTEASGVLVDCILDIKLKKGDKLMEEDRGSESLVRPGLGKAVVHSTISAISGRVVTIDAGTTENVKAGMRLPVYRDNRLIAHLEIQDVDPQESVGFVVDKVLDVRKGDSVTFADEQ